MPIRKELKQVYALLDLTDFSKLETEANKRGIKPSQMLRIIALEYFQIKQARL